MANGEGLVAGQVCLRAGASTLEKVGKPLPFRELCQPDRFHSKHSNRLPFGQADGLKKDPIVHCCLTSQHFFKLELAGCGVAQEHGYALAPGGISDHDHDHHADHMVPMLDDDHDPDHHYHHHHDGDGHADDRDHHRQQEQPPPQPPLSSPAP
jgi:hypothetical protein